MFYDGVQLDESQRSVGSTIQAPTGGLNNRDGLAAMPGADAYVMDNIIPGTLTCSVRPGCEVHVETGLTAGVRSLEMYSGGPAGADQLIAFGGDKIINATVEPVIELRNDMLSDEIVATMFSTVADHAQFLIITTGDDIPIHYNGTDAVDCAFTGPTGITFAYENINSVHSYKGRLFFGVKNLLGFAYLPPGQIQGALEWFDLGQICRRGGRLVAMASYSEDAGDGPDDYIVFITSNGEYIMYTGNDPGDASAWDLVGRYRYAPPVGRRCTTNYAGDLLVLTLDGAIQFSQIRKIADTRMALTALTSKLGTALSSLNAYKDEWGWQMILFPMRGWFLVSVPADFAESGRHYHFVMNTTTQSWGRCFSDEWDALCWVVSNGQLYFGRADGSIRRVFGMDDNEQPIKFQAKQAYSYFGTPQHKHFKWARFLVSSEAPVNLMSQLSVDYREPARNPPVIPLADLGGAIWDVSYWDTDYWASGPYTQQWIAAYGDYGVVGSHWLSGQLMGATFEWFSTEHVFEKAQGLL